jgi:subtilase family serine protease
MRKRRLKAALVTASALAAATLVAPIGAHASSAAKAIPNTKPAWLAHATQLGHASAAVSARIYLTPDGGTAALQQLAVAVSTPGSAQYGQFLTAAQYHAQFDATSSTVSQIRQWLTGAGLTVTGVEAHNRYVSVSGTVSAAEKAFGTTINRYQHDGQTVQANSSALTAPAALASSVLAVSGVDTTPRTVQPAKGKPAPPQPDGFRNAPPCSAYYGEKLDTTDPQFDGSTLPYAPCGYVGSQFRSAYEGATTLDGTGVTVAITDAYASPSIASDASTYAAAHGDAAYTSGQLTEVMPAARFNSQHRCDSLGWYGEETLDVEAVHAMAQGADILYYASASCFDTDFLDTLALVNDQDVADIVSNSWGELESNETASLTAAYEAVFQQGAVEGISFVFSSGDNGDELASSGTIQADYPASDPYVTAVGGTSTAINATGGLAWQTGWGTEKYTLSATGTWDPVGFLYGAGGGESTLFAQPAYQVGKVPAGNRQVPDVGLDADPTTGMKVGETQKFPDGTYYDEYRIGGTSLASPLFAGMTALAFQHAGHGVGLLNPTIYGTTSGAFTDVSGTPQDKGNVRVDYANGVDATGGLLYSVRTFNHDSSLTIGTGWDNVTGLGTPNSAWLIAIP